MSRVLVDWSLHGLAAPIVDNDLVQVTLLPDLGGKVWQIRDLVSRREFIWHNERIRPRPVTFGSTYDDVFHGGWDLLFPNDIPELLADEQYPDHGEVWALPWQWEPFSDTGEAGVVMSLQTPISNCTLVRRVSLRAGERLIRIRESITSNGSHPLPFLWKQHLALRVDEQARVDLPPCDVIVGDFGSPRAGAGGHVFRWPMLTDAHGDHDMRPTLPATSGRTEFLFGTSLPDGWCSLTYADGTGIGLAFDPAVFPSCWTFASYGGWRGLQVAILEPCSGYPLSVQDGIAAGTHQVLSPGATLETEVVVTLFDGMQSVQGIDRAGRVTGEPL